MMVFLLRFQHGLKAVILLIIFPPHATAFGFGKKAKVEQAKISFPEVSEDLTTLLKPIPEDRVKVYTQALELLSSIQASPSCQRLATSNLLEFCHLIDGSQRGSEALIDETRSLYAAQLAVCEIKSANAVVPQRCEAIPLDRNGRTNLWYKKDTLIIEKSVLGDCLQALESRPQWWTSYSNSRQNAVVICEAARSDIEKDDIVNLHKSFIQTHRDADEVLSQAVQSSREELRRQHEEFALVRQAIRKHVLQDIQTAGSNAQSLLEKLMTNLNAGLQAALSGMASTVKNLDNEIANLYVNTKSMNVKSLDLEKNIGKIFQKAAEGTAELASVQTKHFRDSEQLATRLRTSLLQMGEVDVHNLVMVVQDIHSRMESNNDLVVSISARQSAVDQQMARLGQVIVNLQENAQALEDAQLRQESTQARFHDSMEAGFNASLSRLSMIETSTLKLQGALQNASQSVAQLTSLSWILGTLWKWGSLALILSIVATAILSGYTNFARCLAGIIATLAVMKCTIALLRDKTYGNYPVPEYLLIERMIAFGFAIGTLISIGWSYSKNIRHSGAISASPIDLSMHHIGRTSSEQKLHRTWRI